jgi:hypothetical protein
VNRLGDLAVRREPAVLVAQPGAKRLDARETALLTDLAPLLEREPVDVALDGEQHIDAGDHLYGDRRLGEPRQVEDLRRARAQHATSTIGPGRRPAS